MMPNMSYCMFENTSNDMQEIIDKMYEDDFHPDKLSKTERRAFDSLYDQCQTMFDRLVEIHEFLDEEQEAMWDEEDAEEERADEDFNMSSEDYDRHTFTRKD